MSRWLSYPFVRVASAYILGLWIARYIDLPWSMALSVLALVLIVYLAVVIWIKPPWSYRWNTLIGVVALIAFFLTGMLRFSIDAKAPSSLPADGISYYQAVALENSAPRTKTNRTKVELQQYREGSDWKSLKTQVMLYTPLSNREIQYGDRLLVKGAPQIVAGPANPGEFDYRKYLVRKGVKYQQFTFKPEQVKFLDKKPPSRLFAFTFWLRAKGQATIRNYVKGDRQQAIASALLLGIRNGLDNQLKDAYAGAGAIHVLAVSGLHVGIIYMVLLGLLGFLKKGAGGKWIFAFVVLLILWLYAFLTGLSPSVLRATVMFSFIVVAQSTRRDSNIYNTLFTSGLFLLFIDPGMITSVGFQMSYLAVLGIVYLQPKIASWWKPDSWLGHHVWRLTSTSLAAQVAVFPLGIYYFHQFPTYFVLANLVVIPGAFLILSLGFLLLLSSFSAFLAGWVGKLLSVAIGGINQWVVWIEKLPGSPVQYISISTEQLFLLFTVLILLMLFFQYRRFAYVLASVLVWLGFSALLWYQYQNQAKQNRAIFYSIHDHQAVDFYLGRQAHFMSDAEITANLIDYHIAPARVQWGVAAEVATLEGKREENLKLLAWQGNTFAWLDAPFDRNMSKPKITTDFLIVENNSITSLEDLSDRMSFNTLIIGSTNQSWLAQKLGEEAEDLAINYHSLPLQGAFEIKF